MMKYKIVLAFVLIVIPLSAIGDDGDLTMMALDNQAISCWKDIKWSSADESNITLYYLERCDHEYKECIRVHSRAPSGQVLYYFNDFAPCEKVTYKLRVYNGLDFSEYIVPQATRTFVPLLLNDHP